MCKIKCKNKKFYVLKINEITNYNLSIWMKFIYKDDIKKKKIWWENIKFNERMEVEINFKKVLKLFKKNKNVLDFWKRIYNEWWVCTIRRTIEKKT